jgi:hypothetical protein
MLNSIKSLFKVQLQDNNGVLGNFALVNVLKRPCQTIMDGSTFNEAILILMHTRENSLLKSICHKLCQEL